MTELGSDLHVSLRGSVLLLIALCALHLLAAASLLLSDLSPLLRSALMLALLAHAGHCYRRYFLLRGRDAVVAIRWQRDRWWLRLGADDWREAAPCAERVVLWWLIVVRFRVAGDRREVALVLLPDCADADSLRRLRVRLRFG